MEARLHLLEEALEVKILGLEEVLQRYFYLHRVVVALLS